MQLLPEPLKQVLGDRLKSGFISQPRVRVEVDRFSFVPGYVEEITLYETDLQKTIEVIKLDETAESVTKKIPITFPLQGLKWSDQGKKFFMTSKWGMRWGKMHRGTDMQTAGAGNASTVVAAYDGTVSGVDYQAGGAGHYVKIKHADGLETKYFHLKANSIVVSNGQGVKAGQKIAIEGNSGGVVGVVDGGRHLHFETWVNGVNEDSGPWLRGEKTITGKTTVSSGKTKTVVENVIVGYPGAVALNEQMKYYNWLEGSPNTYRTSGNAESVKTKNMNNGYYRTYFKFDDTYRAYQNFFITLNMNRAGWFDLTLSSNFKSADTDSVSIYINEKLAAKKTNFTGLDKAETIKDMAVPSGAVTIRITMAYSGKKGPKTVALHALKIQELDQKRTEAQVKEVPDDDVEVAAAKLDPVKVENFAFKETPVKIHLQTGKFLFQDTLELPNVTSAEVERNLESEASEATVTVTNPDGYFSPDYNPYYFPELMGKYKPSPWSYYIDNNYHSGVLAENTPVRIYMGYGGNTRDNLMRVFTGLIDSTDIDSNNGTLAIKCRDMYKKILNAVLLKRKEYGNEAVWEQTKPTQTTTVTKKATLTRRQQIYAAAKKAQKEYNLPDDAYYFLLAICWHETVFGTQGQGPAPRNMILGYGSFDSNPDYSYGGIEKQMHYGAKRYAEALPSRNLKVDSKSDVDYFFKGGDKGRYQWATDAGNWQTRVWSYYLKITADKKSYAPPNTTETTTVAAGGETKVTGGGADPKYPGTVLKKGSKGSNVKKVQQKLKDYKFFTGSVDGVFGSATDTSVRRFQSASKITVDGKVGKQTWNKLFEVFQSTSTTKNADGSTVKIEYTVDPKFPGTHYKSGMSGSNVKKIQQQLKDKKFYSGKVDGKYGSGTANAVAKFQTSVGIKVDRIVGPVTWNELFRKSKKVKTPAPKPKLIKEGKQWLKTAIITDLAGEAGMFGWRVAEDDMDYPDAIIEESYYVENNPKTGKVVKALDEKKATAETKFETVDISKLQVETPDGWLNPFVEPITKFAEAKFKISDLINDLIKETSYRSYCDRYGTYRLERINYDTPVVAEFRDDQDIISLSKNIDYSRARSHLLIYDDGDKTKSKDRDFASFIDKELLLELKGEARTAVVVVDWAKTDAMKKEVAKKLFFDMKRLSRTMQVSIPGNPHLDVLDRIRIVDQNSGTNGSYHIKGIRDSFDKESGYIQILDLTWSATDQHIQIPGMVMNTEPQKEPKPPEPVKKECILWDKKIYKHGIRKNATVTKIQKKLISLGYSIPDGATGNFLDQTRAAVIKFQKAKGLSADGIVGQLTWNKMFCPDWKAPQPAAPKKISYTTGLSTRSWRDNWKWRTDSDELYQGEWENWGHHYGFIFAPSDLRAKLKGKKIKSVKLYLYRYRKQGYYSSQKPTFWLSTKSSATGSPSVISSSKWNSNVGWAVGDKKWVTLPKSYGEAIRDGKAKSIAIYTPNKSPYICFLGGKDAVRLEIETD